MPVMMMMVWQFCQGCPHVPGPSCRDELPNTSAIIHLLKRRLTALLNTFEREGYYVGTLPEEPICILGDSGISDQSTKLSSIETKLCQYAQCLQHFVNNTREINNFPLKITNALTACQKSLGHLESTIKKMQLEPSALCGTPCTVPWSFAEWTWEEIVKGPRLVQELLTYLRSIQLDCS